MKQLAPSASGVRRALQTPGWWRSRTVVTGAAQVVSGIVVAFAPSVDGAALEQALVALAMAVFGLATVLYRLDTTGPVGSKPTTITTAGDASPVDYPQYSDK